MLLRVEPPAREYLHTKEDANTLAPVVEQAFMDIYHGKNGGGDAKAWLASMKADKRYLVDIWPKN
jgi:hypothetical protein